MIDRALQNTVASYLGRFPVVALLGCRQVGKTTLALRLGELVEKPTSYLDLELPEDRAKLTEPQLFLEEHANRLLILDEIQRVPELFQVMRGLIDRRRRQGEKAGHFLVLGSASPDLLKQSSESLAGRIAYLELDPLNLKEVEHMNTAASLDTLWFRGGFPDSFLSSSDAESLEWREQFIRTYLERDLPQLGPRIPADRIYRLWKMLAFDQGCILNASRLATSLSMSVSSIRNYLEVMADLFLIRLLKSWNGNSKKRLVKSPKVFVRDSGIVHALTGLKNWDALISNSLCGLSWEGFVVEQILQLLPPSVEASYYRSSGGAELDLVLETENGDTIAIEIMRTLEPKISRGFTAACEDIKPHKRYYVIPRGASYPLDSKTRAIGVREFLGELDGLLGSA